LQLLYSPSAHAQGGVPLWTNRYDADTGSSLQSAVAAVVVDRSGNVFVTGRTGQTGLGVPYDYATIKYSNAGVPLWTNRYDGPANSWDYAAAIAVDRSGNVFVTGTSYGIGAGDYATVAYSNEGVPLWTNRYDGPANRDDRAEAIAVDNSGNVFVTGWSWNGTNYDYVTIKYSSSVPPLISIFNC